MAGLLAAGVACAIGERLEDALSNGLPRDELTVYKDALRRGRSLVIVAADSVSRADEIREVLLRAGAESQPRR